jgi:hypothetical protein
MKTTALHAINGYANLGGRTRSTIKFEATAHRKKEHQMTATKQSYNHLEQLCRFENAQETIGFMIAKRSEWIHQEEQKPNPNPNKIEQWTAETFAFEDERMAMRLHDDEAINRVLSTYSPIIKADNERAR